MTNKQIDVKTYNCAYCNKTLTKYETQPLYKNGEFIVTCEECWYKHAKEAEHVVSDVQTINITIDDLINGNLRDMEITAQFGVYRQAVKGLAEQLKRKEQECEEFKELYNYYSFNKRKPKNITELKICVNGTNEELIRLQQENNGLREFQKLLEEQMKFNKSELELSFSSEIKRSEFLLKEFEKADKQRDNWREKAEKLKQTLTEIKEIADNTRDLLYSSCDSIDEADDKLEQILQKCEVLEQ